VAVASVEETYGLDSNFERAAITALCQQPKLYGRIGKNVDPSLIVSPVGKLALESAKSFAGETGSGPDSVVIVLQRLKRWNEQGRVTHEQLEEVLDYFDAALDAGIPSEESIIAEFAPILKRKAEQSAVLGMTDAFGQRKDLTIFSKKLEEASRIGSVDTSLGERVGSTSFAIIESVRNLERLPFDVPELDLILEGGLARKCLGVAVADSGGGKSMLLSHIAASSMFKGIRVAYATLELTVPMVLARIKANLTGLPVNSIANGSLDEAKRRMLLLEAQLGTCYVKDFTPHSDTVQDALDWVDAIEQTEGFKIDLLVTDYADKFGFGPKTKESDTYTGGRIVYEKLRIDAVDNDRWSWTASQSTRKQKDTKRLDIQHVADSMNKVRVADLVLTLNVHDDGASLEYYVAKNRLGVSRQSIGPLPQDWKHGRTADIIRGGYVSSGADQGYLLGPESSYTSLADYKLNPDDDADEEPF
jgi:replicative DNA helicase